MPKIKINDKLIGDDEPCYTIAEAGANHDGTLEKALRLIDAAIEAQADSIKFQTYTATSLTTKNAPKYWKDNNPDETQFDVFKKLDSLTEEQWKEIFEYANKKNITCFSTPFDEKSVDLLYSLGVPAFKIASADITHLPLIKYVANKKIPIFLSTGMASNDEIDQAVDVIENTGNHQIIIMHCITSYPTKPEDANLEIIRELSKKYRDYVVGYSDHTLGTTVAVCSTFYGAKCIEKHFTYNNDLTTSPDHRLSLDVNDFNKLVNRLKVARISKGENMRQSFDSEAEAVKYARRSIVSKISIKKNTKITDDMLIVKRPATGIYPKYLDKVIGAIAINDIEEDRPIQWDDIRTQK